MFRDRIHSKKGAALITSVMVMLMVSMFGLAYVALTTTNLLRAGRDERRATAFHLAEAGLEYVVAQITTQAETNGGKIMPWNFNSSSLLDSLRSPATGTVVVTPDTGVSKYATVTSSATYRGITETVRVRLKIRNVGIWDNAIFAGIGQSGRGINGNVDVRGSVHILGEGEPFSDLNGNGVWDAAEPFTDNNGNGIFEPELGDVFSELDDLDGNGLWSDAEPFQDNNLNGVYDPPLTATELASDISGDAQIGNNYDGMPSALQSKIPALVPEPFGGESVYTLNAELRVKHGKVNVSGSATIGLPNVMGNAVKETMDGCYVSDGYGGNQGANNVYSDNGASQLYDLGDRVSFPGLLDPYTDPGTGVLYSTYEDYLVAKSLVIPVLTINSATPDFEYTDGANSILWDSAASTIAITGIIRIPGGLDICVKDQTLNFTGRGTLFAQGDVSVHGDVMPIDTFPTWDVLGVIAKGNINFATGSGESQIQAVGAWYAQGQINSAKQSQFAGSYVANFFNMGTNVPNIYQVPELATNLPPGMPGGDVRIVIAQVLSWRHL